LIVPDFYSGWNLSLTFCEKIRRVPKFTVEDCAISAFCEKFKEICFHNWFKTLELNYFKILLIIFRLFTYNSSEGYFSPQYLFGLNLTILGVNLDFPFFNRRRQERDKLVAEIQDLQKKVAQKPKIDPASYIHDYSESDSIKGRDTRVSYSMLEQIYKKESWVRAAIDVIVRTATSNGWRLVSIEDRIDSKEAVLSKELSLNSQVGALKDLLEEPNADDTFSDIVAEIITDLHIYGDAYVEVVRDRVTDLPVALYNVYCPSMRIKVDEHGKILGYVQVFDWQIVAEFEVNQIVHFRLINPGSEVYGLSPLESLIIPIETDLYAQAYNKNFFKNDATPRLHVDLGNCTLPQLKRMREYWRTVYKGGGKSHKTIITEGGAKITPIGTPPKDMEFLNQRKFNRDEILAVLGVPPIMVGIVEGANRANSKEQANAFKTEKIIPLQKMLAAKLNKLLISEFTDKYTFKFAELDLRDALDAAQIDQIDLEMGIRDIEEVRRARGLSPKKKPSIEQEEIEEPQEKPKNKKTRRNNRTEKIIKFLKEKKERERGE